MAAQRDARSHKLNVRLRAHWGRHDLMALNPLGVLLQPQTAPDGPAMAWASKQNPAPMNPPPQLLTPCAWTVPQHEEGLGCLPWFLERGGWAQ